MKVGILQIELRLYSPQSLKEKRSIIKPMKQYIRRHHNVSVSEIGHLNSVQSSQLAIVTVGESQLSVHKNLGSISSTIENRYPVTITGEHLEII